MIRRVVYRSDSIWAKKSTSHVARKSFALVLRGLTRKVQGLSLFSDDLNALPKLLSY